ncbi:conjugal transfer protein [Alcaligenes sp. CHO6]|uniref:conjugal transfer protein n=1 Tax=Alcaligenes sp. CHO6 TaxID=3123298 RepID=UPI003014CAA6
MFVKQYLTRLAQNHVVRHVYQSAIVAMLTTNMAYAQAIGGLNKAKTTLEALRDALIIILPIACVIAGLVIWVLYSAEVMRKEDATRWAIGVIGAGSVIEIVALLWRG